jgi:hypothetical protein
MGETITAGTLDFHAETRTAGGGDGGPSLQVWGTSGDSRVELLRFDMFHGQPHYHYAPMGRNLRYDLDPLTLDDGIGWVMNLLRNRFPQLVAKAGYEELAGPDNVAATAAALPEIERKWRASV